MTDLFVEIFPVETEALSSLSAYQLYVDSDLNTAKINRLGNRLAQNLKRSFTGNWLWADGRILTDSERNPIELTIAADILRSEQPASYGILQSIEPDTHWQPSPRALAEFMLRTHLRGINTQMRAALDKLDTRIRNASVEREHKLQPWIVNEQPAISISIASRLIYDQNLQQYAGTERDLATLNDKLIGLGVSHNTAGIRGEIVLVVGPIVHHRERLLDTAPDNATREKLLQAMDGEWVIAVRSGQEEYEFLASTLQLIVRLPHIRRYDVDPRQAIESLQMKPAVRAMHVKVVSDMAKEAGLLANAYNARTTPDLFFSADFEMNLRFDANRVRPYKAEALSHDFSRCGVYKLRDAFQAEPIRVCVVNTLTLKLEDFVEALQRQLKRNFDFTIDVIRERQVRVVSRPNLESAVRVVEKENPDIILAFFPDELDTGDDEDTDTDATASYIKSLTLGRGLPTHVIYQSTLDDPEAMPGIILNILGKTGNAPFVLAEPLEHTDYVVGLDVVRQYIKTTGETRLTAIARVYCADGEFSHYVVRNLTLQDEIIPYVLMRDLLSQRTFAKKRVVIHHDGAFEPDLLTALSGWGQAIDATFYPVEIVRFGAPRLYAIENSAITQPPWGSAFKLSDTEALLISSLPKEDVTPQPLHIRTVSAVPQPPLPIEKALRSVLVWSLLAYNVERLPKFPVTVINTDELAHWLSKGGAFGADEGQVPFWL